MLSLHKIKLFTEFPSQDIYHGIGTSPSHTTFIPKDRVPGKQISVFPNNHYKFFGYKPNLYKITVDGKVVETRAFLITVANAGQWGNDVYIAPEAELTDGILNVSILKEFPKAAIPMIGIKLFSKKIHTSINLHSEKGKNIDIEFAGELPVHFDGEPITATNKLSISVMPLALKIVC